jgi:uncharacterized protein
MNFRLLNNRIVIFALVLTFISEALTGQDFPEPQVPPRLVNDFAGMLTQQEINALEQKLVAFDDTTSTQISIITVSDLMGYDKADYAQRLAELWGIGRQGSDNGVLILVKPKTFSSQGQVQITTGYGLEGAIPDILCGEIVDYEILPEFRQGNYYEGLDKATSTLMSLASGEFTAGDYRKGGDVGELVPLIIFIIVIMVILFMRSSGGSNQKHISRNGLPLWVLMSMMNSGGSKHSGSWGGFSGGGGFRGGGGGGFGGFGGGSFGGGGAGGSW